MAKNEITTIELTEENIESMVYEIRGQKVMLDFDLARIYGYETKNFNRQVKNNIEKFPSDFMFQLSKEELGDALRPKILTTEKNTIESEEILMSKKLTSSEEKNLKCKNFTSSWGGTRKLPYAFTEQGIYMLMTVLKGELATKQSKALIRLFKNMKDYIGEIANNPYNTIVNNKRLAIQREFDRIAGSDNRIGYLVINNFRVSRQIAEKLGINNKLVLLVSKGKIMSIYNEHNITADQFVNVIRKAAFLPEAIVYDSARESFQFFVRLGDDSYRTVIEFGAVPIGMKNVKADVLTTLFKNKHFENRIKSIEDNRYPNLSLVYKK